MTALLTQSVNMTVCSQRPTKPPALPGAVMWTLLVQCSMVSVPHMQPTMPPAFSLVAVTVPVFLDVGRAKALLAYAHHEARLGFRVRAGYLPRQGTAVFAIRLQEREVTLPMVNQAFAVLWRIAQEFGGAR